MAVGVETVVLIMYSTMYGNLYGTVYRTVAGLPLVVLGVETVILTMFGTIYGTVYGMVYGTMNRTMNGVLAEWLGGRIQCRGHGKSCHHVWRCEWRNPVEGRHPWNRVRVHRQLGQQARSWDRAAQQMNPGHQSPCCLLGEPGQFAGSRLRRRWTNCYTFQSVGRGEADSSSDSEGSLIPPILLDQVDMVKGLGSPGHGFLDLKELKVAMIILPH